ncbi:hypothetical protein BKA70DRAFT_1182670 [Coprinopsis sp. MPI-PUGE-AT-0042]|nr:hypothetical protein BKA70DRAFT_1182670 [Coprinopsis sp. MPI-PUGE-AT-0042]
MLLAKLPLLLVSALAIHVSLTPPQAPASVNEKVPSGTLREAFIDSHVWTLKIAKALWWCGALAEVASIILLESKSEQLLQYLQFSGGNLDALTLSPGFLFGVLIASIGALGRLSCYRALGKYFTFEMSIKKDHGLIKTGPYSVVRHPSYTAMALNCLGMFFAFMCPGSWTRESGVLNTLIGKVLIIGLCILYPTIVVALIQRLPEEEATLQKLFGKEWEQWRKEVPYKLIPFVY